MDRDHTITFTTESMFMRNVLKYKYCDMKFFAYIYKQFSEIDSSAVKTLIFAFCNACGIPR